MSTLAGIRAQVEAEVKTRLRSPATLVAAVALFAASFFWIPDPAKNAVSIAWKGPAGEFTSGLYESAYVGASAAILAALFLTLIGFYLVAGSVRRDEETRVGAILAATPLSKTAYLTGKWVAHFVYLGVLGLVSVLAGMLVFFRYGTGAFSPGDFLAPFFLLVLPGLGFTAASALLFDVTPGLRSRGGWVLFFFFWTFVYLAIPAIASGGFTGRQAGQSLPLFDPTGLASFTQWIANTVPGGQVNDISIGLMVLDEPLTRISWPGLEVGGGEIVTRLVSFVWVAGVLALAVMFFDRFDPSRRGGRSQKPIAKSSPATLDPALAPTAARSLGLAALPRLASPLAPGFASAVLAEVRLLWLAAGRWRWVLGLVALGAAFPGPAPRPGVALFLLILIPVISEAAAREHLAGTEALVFSQPGVPNRRLWWKTAAMVLFVVGLGLPGLVGGVFFAPRQAPALLGGLLFVAVLATALGSLSRGGKLFSGITVALWYAAVNGAPALDWSGVLAPGTKLSTPWAYCATSLLLLAASALLDRRQR